jgi:hypothetical protein
MVSCDLPVNARKSKSRKESACFMEEPFNKYKKISDRLFTCRFYEKGAEPGNATNPDSCS